MSFLLANQVNVYEQQSTPSANMPLRDLFYIADLFQKQFLNKSIYSSKRLQIPTPCFVVFYNGMNGELKAKCPVLREYTEYIDTVRNYAKIMDISSAVEKAVDDCIRK